MNHVEDHSPVWFHLLQLNIPQDLLCLLIISNNDIPIFFAIFFFWRILILLCTIQRINYLISSISIRYGMSIVLQNFFHDYGIFGIFSRICFANWAVFLRSFPCYVVPTSLEVKCHQQYKDCRNEQYSCQHDCQDHRNGEKSRLSLWKVNNSEFLPFETRSACHGNLFETRWMREERVGEKIRKLKQLRLRRRWQRQRQKNNWSY